MIWLDRNENQFGHSPTGYAALQETPWGNLGVYSRDFLRGVKSTLSESGMAIKFLDEKDLPCCARITIGIPEQNTRLLEILQRYFT
jgi:histidinol-phosphate/aromatic aminotransferase/cobyric acid decarboxylase-like protein